MRHLKKFQAFCKEAYLLGHFPSLFTVLFTKWKIYIYYGFLGDRNFGDELVFEATKELFKPNILLPVKKRMPLSLKLYCKLFRKRLAGVVIGGGTLMGNLFYERGFFYSLARLGKPIYVHGTGVNKDVEYEKGWKRLLSGSIYGGVRGPLSIENLNRVSINMRIAGDAAFAFFDEKNWSARELKNNKVLLNLGTHVGYKGQTTARLELEKFIGFLITEGYTVQFLPLHSKDWEIGRQLKAVYPEIVLLPHIRGYRHAASIFKECSFAIGERLHFIVMAILTKTPFISVNYEIKHEDLLQSVHLSEAGLLPDEVLFGKLVGKFENRDKFDWTGVSESINYLRRVQCQELSGFVTAN